MTGNTGVFGSVGHSIATTDENGARATFGIGVSLLFGRVTIAG